MESMTDTVPYTVTGNPGDVEFRKYPAMILATVSGGPEEKTFSLLFHYITGPEHINVQRSVFRSFNCVPVFPAIGAAVKIRESNSNMKGLPFFCRNKKECVDL